MLLSTTVAEHASAVTYKATIINTVGYDSPTAAGISGTSIFGSGNPSSGPNEGGIEALLWDATTNSVVSLNPAEDWGSQGEDVSGGSQVGHGSGLTTGFAQHALLWHGTAASFVDLNPAGFSNTYANGISGNNQVGLGSGDLTGGFSHALLWHGAADSVVDLHPEGFVTSWANEVFEDSIVGAGSNTAPLKLRALLWHGTAASVVDLHPAAFPQSLASDVSQDSQVGTGIISSVLNGERHALLWHGTAASVIDLHPAGFNQTSANAVAGSLQVGFGVGTATGGNQHALLWEGSAASVVDLHALLTGLGPTFISSYAYDIDESGVIVGTAGTLNTSYAVMWSPVPEPSTLLLLALAWPLLCPRGHRVDSMHAANRHPG